MSISRENISLWLQQSEPDYYLFFLKAWIPFNAWYVAEYPELQKKDCDIISKLQESADSKPRRIIENFLSNSNDHESFIFRSYLAELNYFLEKIPFTHNNNRLSFKNLFLFENPVKYNNGTDIKGNVYKVEKTSSYFQAYIQSKGGKVLLDFKKPIYNLEDLTKDNHYIRLEKKIQNKIYSLYKTIDPNKPTSLLYDPKIASGYIQLKSKNSCKLIKDKTNIAKGCLNILYALRCMLFHGEIAPTNTNKSVYKYAYLLLHLIINEIN